MRRLLLGIIVAGAAGMIALALIAQAEAKTCSDRLKVCHRFCAKSESDRRMRRQMRRIFVKPASRAAAGKASTSTRNAALPGNRRPRFRVHDEIADVLERDGR